MTRRHVATPLVVAAVLLAAGALAGCAGGGARATPTPAPVAADEHVVLVRGQALVLHADGGRERTLFTETSPNVFPAFPAWSPDGTRIAFAVATFGVGSGVDWGDDVYVLTPGARGPRLVRRHTATGQQIQGIAWLPDGRSLLVGYRQTVIAHGAFGGVREEIDRVDVETGASTPFAAGAIEPSVALRAAPGAPAVAYLHGPPGGRLGLWVAAVDGSGAREVALPAAVTVVAAPRLAPDGSAIAFSAPAPAGVTPASSATPGATPHAAAWRRLLALLPFAPRAASAHGLPMDVWRVDLPPDGAAVGSVAQLTHVAADDPRSAWAADGRSLVVIATGGLYRLARDGSTFTQIGDGAFLGELDVR